VDNVRSLIELQTSSRPSLKVKSEWKSGLRSSPEWAKSGGDERRWKYNAGPVLRLGENFNNQTEIQESIYSAL
jgi:hypothetical protein